MPFFIAQQTPGCSLGSSSGNHDDEDNGGFPASGSLKNKSTDVKAESVGKEPRLLGN